MYIKSYTKTMKYLMNQNSGCNIFIKSSIYIDDSQVQYIQVCYFAIFFNHFKSYYKKGQSQRTIEHWPCM